MGDREPDTMAEAIGEHVRRQRASDQILEELVRSDRSVAEVYGKIRDVLARPELKGRAVVDAASNRIYALHAGVVHDYEIAWADAIEMDLAFLQERDTIISVGEAS